MLALKRLPPALAGVGVGMTLISVPAAYAADQPGRLGAFRTELGQLTDGLSISLAQGVRYESNLVRTANDAETIAIYGTDDASDFVSQTSLNIGYRLDGNRIKIDFGGDISYAHYFNFDQFSGLVTGGSGSVSWQFTDRCSTGINGRVERRVADFADVAQTGSDVQNEFNGSLNLGCFIMERIRLSGGVSGDTVRNEEAIRKIANADNWGYNAAVAFVSAHGNEIGARFSHSETTRPNDPATPEVTNERIVGFTRFKVGNYLSVSLSGGNEQVARAGSPTTDRSTASGDIGWTPTGRLTARVGYDRQTEDATDLLGTTSQTDRIRGNLGWQLSSSVSMGAYGQFEDNTLTSSAVVGLTGVTEQRTTAGLSLQHSLFHMVSVSWSLGYARRDSDNPLRDFDGVTAGVSLGIAI